ncbi:hypothetical protein K438DRAFT_1756549 [Mycena galopus ATCC 62051]|nr:hypothetical protein K438DRAFT_1756549 [Mycena galopus ATCC 62051]
MYMVMYEMMDKILARLAHSKTRKNQPKSSEVSQWMSTLRRNLGPQCLDLHAGTFCVGPFDVNLTVRTRFRVQAVWRVIETMTPRSTPSLFNVEGWTATLTTGVVQAVMPTVVGCCECIRLSCFVKFTLSGWPTSPVVVPRGHRLVTDDMNSPWQWCFGQRGLDTFILMRSTPITPYVDYLGNNVEGDTKSGFIGQLCGKPVLVVGSFLDPLGMRAQNMRGIYSADP